MLPLGDGELTAHSVKEFAVEADNLNSTPGPHTMGESSL